MMSNNYFDVDDLLSSFEMVPVSVKGNVQNLGALDPRQTTATLAKGTDLLVPLWLAEGIQRHKLFTAQVPVQLDEKQVYTMQLDARSFRPEFKFTRNYFATLVRMCNLLGQKHEVHQKKVLEALRVAVQQRTKDADKEFKSMCEAERLVIRTRREMMEAFSRFQVLILQ